MPFFTSQSQSQFQEAGEEAAGPGWPDLIQVTTLKHRHLCQGLECQGRPGKGSALGASSVCGVYPRGHEAAVKLKIHVSEGALFPPLQNTLVACGFLEDITEDQNT